MKTMMCEYIPRENHRHQIHTLCCWCCQTPFCALPFLHCLLTARTSLSLLTEGEIWRAKQYLSNDLKTPKQISKTKFDFPPCETPPLPPTPELTVNKMPHTPDIVIPNIPPLPERYAVVYTTPPGKKTAVVHGGGCVFFLEQP